jgi:predicted acetylornithine/succinylornithine family transaminase
MNTQEIINLTQQYVMPTYKRLPVAFVRGEGCYLYDAEGKRYLDWLAGIAVNGLGHGHPKIAQILAAQAAKLVHTSNLFYVQSQAELARALCESSFADQVFFCNSGAEANETAVKLARKFQKKQKGPNAFEIIAMEQSFHGRTIGMISATGQEKIKRGFEPLLPGFRHVPFDDLPALRAAISPKTCAVLLEPVQGEGGVRFPGETYLRDVRKLCRENGALLILDEVQTGLGRTGKLFAYQHFGIEPDIMTLAKSLGTGLPIGACLATKNAASAFEPGDHASTFGGNFLVCEVAKAFVEILLKEGLLERIEKVGKHFLARLQELKKKFPVIQEVRGRGLMLGAALSTPGAPLVLEGLKRGLILNCTQDTVLRFVPPLIITEKEIDEGIGILEGILADAGGRS